MNLTSYEVSVRTLWPSSKQSRNDSHRGSSSVTKMLEKNFTQCLADSKHLENVSYTLLALILLSSINNDSQLLLRMG